ncbi:PhoX family phosphatase [Nocardioides iriomotensis]|uniref:PhoX family phosphatase n=2 Tax=Nocardioides iriomotensis TaxID=715784 RepID=A0A4Q5J866_9ACTN|nr:PhoX family phosphatase [Nocardioides iriomotensis]
MTCRYKCGNACDQPVPNTSANQHVQDVITTALARRSVLKVGGGALALSAVSSFAPAAAKGNGAPAGAGLSRNLGATQFSPVPPNTHDDVTTADGFTSDVVIRWGDPVVAGAPGFDADNQTPESAAKQFGYNNDYVGVLPLAGRRHLLVTNHEYTNEELMFPAGRYSDDAKRKIAIQSHGLSVVEIVRDPEPGGYTVRPVGKAPYNRRITGTTPFTVDGPAAGDARLRTAADPTGKKVLGTFNNCAGGTTPWGTVLSGEENFNQYFGTDGALDTRYTASYARLGISRTGDSSRKWRLSDPRFDLTTEPHEVFRFGWVVEVDPYDPTSTPVKHTMLGRFKHEGANVTISRGGHAVAYMGDDERGDYLYKFVSAERFDPTETQQAKKHNMTLLTKGTLYVARLTGDGAADGVHDGTGEWIRLTTDTESFVPGMSVVDVLIDTRLAADKVAPTKMDRPEDVEPNPVSGKIYAALTNNTNRGNSAIPVDEANPVAGNKHGYVLEITENAGDHTGTAFTWLLLLVCGDPNDAATYFGGFPKDQVSPISCPDNVAFDRQGNLWISTDGNALGYHDGLFRVPLTGAKRGQVQQFLSMPTGAETCGPLISEDQLTAFVAVQHPGEKGGSTFETPASTWPHTDAFPRPSVVAAYRA